MRFILFWLELPFLLLASQQAKENKMLGCDNGTNVVALGGDCKQSPCTINRHPTVDGKPEQSNLMVDISTQTDWKLIKYKLRELGYTLRNLVIDFDSITDWNTDKQRELLELRTKYGFNIIYKAMLSIPGYNTPTVVSRNLIDKLTYTNTTSQCLRYPNYLLCNGGVILNVFVMQDTNGPALAKLLFAELGTLDINTGMHKIKCQQLYLNFTGPGMLGLLNNVDFWTDFRTYYMNIIDNQYIRLAGLILPYHELISSTNLGSNACLPPKLKISRLIPVILDIGTNNPFYLEKSMLTDTPGQDFVESINGLTKFYNTNCITHLLVSQDLMDANIPINEKRALYIQLMNLLNAKKLFSLDTIINYLNSNKLIQNDNNTGDTGTLTQDDVFTTYDKECERALANKMHRRGLKERKPADMITRAKEYTTGFIYHQVSTVLKYFGFELSKI